MIFRQKIEVLKSVKNDIFLKGLVHGFCPKIELFSFGIFLGNQVREKHFFIFWIEKNDF